MTAGPLTPSVLMGAPFRRLQSLVNGRLPPHRSHATGQHTDPPQLTIAPLVPSSPTRLPAAWDDQFVRERCHPTDRPPQFRTCLPVNSRRPSRRAEHGASNVPMNGTRYRLHHGRPDIQLAMYRFAIETCLGLGRSTPMAVLPTTLLDLGCGHLNRDHLMIDSMLSHRLPRVIGVDLFTDSPNLPNDVIHSVRSDCFRCDLVPPLDKQLRTQPPPFIPLRDKCADHIVSISYLQWITAMPNPAEQLYRFFAELGRLLIPGGECVLQFYPYAESEVQLVCESCVKVIPRLAGCRIYTRPLVSRGIKLFVYLARE